LTAAVSVSLRPLVARFEIWVTVVLAVVNNSAQEFSSALEEEDCFNSGTATETPLSSSEAANSG
jgi:hypothetical protein